MVHGMFHIWTSELSSLTCPVQVDVAFRERVAHFVPLALYKALADLAAPPEEIKYLTMEHLAAIKQMPLINRGRLSVQPVSKVRNKTCEVDRLANVHDHCREALADVAVTPTIRISLSNFRRSHLTRLSSLAETEALSP